MSLKRFVSVFVVFVVLFAAAPVLAEKAWYTCDIVFIGTFVPKPNQPTGGHQFMLREINDVFNTWFLVTDVETKNAFLSVFLTAMTTNRRVKVYLDPADNSSLEHMYVETCDFAPPCQ